MSPSSDPTPTSSLLNQTAAMLMAAAVVELFPGTFLVGGQGTPDRFFYDYVFPFKFKENFITLIEERMRLILKEKREVRLLEMVPSNAADLLAHQGQPLMAESVLAVERATVTLCQIGPFACYCPYPLLEMLTLPAFKILEGFSLSQEGQIRIVGVAGLTKEEVKQAAKQPLASTRSHLQLAKNLKLLDFILERWVWLPRGEELRQRLIQWWKEALVYQKIQCIASSVPYAQEADWMALHREQFLHFGSPRIAEIALLSAPKTATPPCGLLTPESFFGDRVSLFCPDAKLLEECISSLQFILRIPKILGFKFETVLSVSSTGHRQIRAEATALLQRALEALGLPFTTESLEPGERRGLLASIDVRIADALGRRWTGPYVGLPEAPMPAGKGGRLVCSTFGSLERFVALLLEQRGGQIPLFLASEQVRILVASTKSAGYAEQVCAQLRKSGFRAAVDGAHKVLKERLYEAMKERVPYVLLLGEREEAAHTLTLRAYGDSKEQSLSLDELCMRLKSEMGDTTSELTH